MELYFNDKESHEVPQTSRGPLWDSAIFQEKISDSRSGVPHLNLNKFTKGVIFRYTWICMNLKTISKTLPAYNKIKRCSFYAPCDLIFVDNIFSFKLASFCNFGEISRYSFYFRKTLNHFLGFINWKPSSGRFHRKEKNKRVNIQNLSCGKTRDHFRITT